MRFGVRSLMFMRSSTSCNDWLGPGVYFWQANPSRALKFAEVKHSRERGDWEPAVVGAVIEPRLCLDLSTAAGINQIKIAHEVLIWSFRELGTAPPENAGGHDLLLRKLDCAVVGMFHEIRKALDREPVDTVSGVFIEGDPIYENEGFYEKTHIQFCVCNPDVIKGVFRVRDDDLRA